MKVLMGIRQEKRGGQSVREELEVGKGKLCSLRRPCRSTGCLLTSFPHLQMDRCSDYPPLPDQSPGLRHWETWLPLLSGGAMQWTQSEGFQVHAPPIMSHPCLLRSCPNISLLKETGNLGVSGDSLLVQVIFPHVFGVSVIQTRSVQKRVFPSACVSCFFILICGGFRGFLGWTSHCCVHVSCPLGSVQEDLASLLVPPSPKTAAGRMGSAPILPCTFIGLNPQPVGN